MKNIFYILVLTVAFGTVANAQILSNSVPAPAIFQSNAFLDASTNYGSINGEQNSIHKGLIFPDVDLRTFAFENVIADGATIPGYYDGMVVYNTGTGNTGNDPATQGVQVAVAPGFYYFSNPTGNTIGGVSAGRWLPLGGSGVKSKTVTADADGVSATLPLTTLDDSDLVTFLGAKIYDAAGKLVMTADSEYNAATNVLNTGNGFMYQALAAGTYTVIVDYK